MKQKLKTFSLSLRTIVASVICLSIVLLSLLNMYQAYEGMKAGVISVTQAMAQYLSTSGSYTVKTTFAPSSVSLHFLRHSRIINAKTLEERLAALPLFVETLNSNKICSAVFIGYNSGEFFLLRRFAGSHPLITSPPPPITEFLLQTVTYQDNGYFQSEFFFYDKDLNLLEKRLVENYNFDPRTRPWYSNALNKGQISITPPYIFFSTNEIGMTFSLEAGNQKAVIGIDTTAKDFSIFLNSLRMTVTPGAEIVVIDETQKVVAYPDIDRLFIKDGKKYRLPQLSEMGIPVFEKMYRSNIPDNLLKKFEVDSKSWYGLSSQFSSITGRTLKLLIAIPSDALLAGVWAHILRQGSVAASIIGILLVFGWWLGTRLVKPLHKLTAQVYSLSNFDFNIPIGVNTIVSEVRELGTVFTNMAETINSFQVLSLTINREEDLEIMLKSVLRQLLRMVHSESGVIYLYDREHSVLRNAVSMGMKEFPDIQITTEDISDHSLEKQVHSYLGQQATISILRNRGKNVVGVLGIHYADGEPLLRESSFVSFVNRIAGSAAVAIETRQLILAQKALLDSIIKLVAYAIDTKSRYTGGHCLRVPVLASMIMEEMLASQDPPFQNFNMDAAKLEEFRIAAWLHDCGKITTPEYVVDKATKLETIYNRIHEIRMRFEVLHRDAEIAYLKDLLAGENEAIAKEKRDSKQKELQEDFYFIGQCNIGTEFMAEKDLDRLQMLSEKIWMRYFDDTVGLSKDEASRLSRTQSEKPLLPVPEHLLADKLLHIVPWGTEIPNVKKGDPLNVWGFDMPLPACMYNYGELHNLSIKKGTLTDEERYRINDHIIQTIRMLSSLELPPELNLIPDIAGNHHEHMDGKGYPRKLTAKDMSLPERLMAIADIFEALTAFDRPYKDGKSLTQALKILSEMAKEGHIDKDIYNLFLRSGVYNNYAQLYLHPQQIDEVTIEDFLA